MMKYKKSGLAILAVLGLSMLGTAQAAVFDFGAMGTGPGGVDVGVPPDPLTVDGISISISATPTTHSVPYLDAKAFKGREAGLGVCSSGLDGAGQCKVRSDDNVKSGEVLHLVFDQNVKITDLTFKDDAHRPITDPLNMDMIDIAIDGDSLTNVLMTSLAGSGLSTPGTHFDFGYNNKQFYIATLTAVPLPAALPLLLSALTGLGLIGWRRGRSVDTAVSAA